MFNKKVDGCRLYAPFNRTHKWNNPSNSKHHQFNFILSLNYQSYKLIMNIYLLFSNIIFINRFIYMYLINEFIQNTIIKFFNPDIFLYNMHKTIDIFFFVFKLCDFII